MLEQEIVDRIALWKAFPAERKPTMAQLAGGRVDLIPVLEKITSEKSRSASKSPSFPNTYIPDLLLPNAFSIPGYPLIRLIGHGGQARVYEGINASTGIRVAVKVSVGGDFVTPEQVRRMDREAQMLAKIDHPNIVRINHRGTTAAGSIYLVMNYIRGWTMLQWLEERWKPSGSEKARTLLSQQDEDDPTKPLRMFVQVCSAIEAAHRLKIVHRDLKPANIVIDPRGEPHILDFGIARPVTGGETRSTEYNPRETHTGLFIGSLHYASPEQAAGKPEMIDVRSDVYALGVILYQIITGGRFPYQVEGSFTEIIQHILHKDPIPPTTALESLRKSKTPAPRRPLPTVNRHLEAIVLKAISKNREERYASAGVLGQAVYHYLAIGPAWEPVESSRPKASRSRRALVVGGVLCACGVAPFLLRGRGPVVVAEQAATQPSTSRSNLPVVDAATKPAAPATEPTRVNDLTEHSLQAEREAREKAAELVDKIKSELEAARLALESERKNREAAEKGLASAQQELLRNVEQPADTEKDRIRKLADSGDPKAMGALGVMYARGQGGIRRDDVEALRWLRKAADAGDGQGMAELGTFYKNGRGGLKPDAAEAVSWYQKAAQISNPDAMHWLAHMYDRGSGGLVKSEVEANRWYRRSAEGGDLGGLFHLGSMYKRGAAGLPKNEAEAVRCFRRAAESGNTNSMDELGECYRYGLGGLTKDDAQAVVWYRKAADAGNEWGMIHLASMYRNGLGGLTKSLPEAVHWYEKAANEGQTEAMNYLGVIYELGGDGLPKDLSLALTWYQKAADAGDAQAMNNLGTVYEYGKGQPKDDAVAAQWYRKAADLGNARAMLNLGLLYQRGAGELEKSDTEAVRWFQKSADAGNTRGIARYGLALVQGTGGTTIDREQGITLLRKAAATGDTWAIDRLKELKAN